MTAKKRIKFECFVAYCHSRFLGLEIAENEGQKIQELAESNVEDVGKDIVVILGKISSIQKVNKHVTSNKNRVFSELYHKNYSSLTRDMDKLIPNEEPIIPALIGLSLLMGYIERDLDLEYGKINVTKNQLDDVLNTFEIGTTEEHKKIVFKMQGYATKLLDLYFKPVRKLKDKI